MWTRPLPCVFIPQFFPLHPCTPPPLLLSFPFSSPLPLSLWQMGFNKSWQSDEIKGEHPMASYSSSLSVALTYLKQGLNSVACTCFTSPGFTALSTSLLLPDTVLLQAGKKTGARGGKRLAAPPSLCQEWPPYKTVYSIDPISWY